MSLLVLVSLLVRVPVPVPVQVQVKQNGTSQSTVEQGVLIGAQHGIAKQGWPEKRLESYSEDLF